MANPDSNGIHEILSNAIHESTQNVFGTMLGLSIEGAPAERVNTAPAPNGGVVSFIGLAGPWVGTGSLSMSTSLACRLSGALLMADYTAVNEDVLDAVAEITNMIVGNVKTTLEEQLGEMGLSIPTVIFGRNFTTRSVGSHEWTARRFRCEGCAEGDDLWVHVCLMPRRESSPARGFGAGPLAEVSPINSV